MKAKHPYLSTKITTIYIILFMGLSGALSGQDCGFSLGCNDKLQVSIDASCSATITAAMMLEAEEAVEGDFKITITDRFNNILPSNVVDQSYVGQVLTVEVKHIECGIACWGEIKIENKFKPFVEICEDFEVSCTDSLEPGVIPIPEFNDQCSEGVELTYIDSIDIRPCSDEFELIVKRKWTAEDADGYLATCTQIISVLRIGVNEVEFPPNYDNIDNPVFECAEIPDSLIMENGAPFPEVTGYPTGVECPKIQYHFADLVFDICGSSKKIFRQWTVIDWCTGADTIGNQIIKILDTQDPVCKDNSDTTYVISTDPGKCTARYVVPLPEVTQECSEYSYTVGHKLKKGEDDPFSDLHTYDVIFIDDRFIIPELPVDTSYIVYTITDACNNSTQCYIQVAVKDMQSPTAICEGYTVISLDNEGKASLWASSIDDHSWDNCGIDSFAIKKEFDSCGYNEDLEFSNKIHFCCEDATRDYIMVTLRVYDIHGNFGDCRVQVRVQDKQAPVITCPPDTVLLCDQDRNDLNITGMATAIDNCNPEIYYRDNTTGLDKCGIGIVKRTWYAEDPNGKTTTCIQEIEIKSEYEFVYDSIEWPKDVTITGCSLDDLHPDGKAGRPEYKASACMDIAESYKDNVFYDTDGVCMKIVRTWKLIDWCTFDTSNPQFIEHRQIIKLNDSEAPKFLTNCNDRTLQVDQCEELVEILVVANDNCTPQNKLKYVYKVDLESDGDIDIIGSGQRLNRYLRTGNHHFFFTVEDECGNMDTCEFQYIITTDKAPTPVCLSETVLVMEADGTSEAWASDFDTKSINACGDSKGLIFSFTEDGQTPSIVFECEDLENGISTRIPLQMWVIDTFGRKDYCDVTLYLQDDNANNTCPNDPNARANIVGLVVTEDKAGLEEVEVNLDDITMDQRIKVMTRENGSYAFGEVDFFHDYEVLPYKNDDTENGVSTLDLVYLQQYIMGLRSIESPYKLIAADINGDKRISAQDLLELRKLILGYTDEFVSNTSWRFIPASFEFTDPKSPWDYQQEIAFQDLISIESESNFMGIKIGDLNGNAVVKMDNRSVRTRSISTATLILDYDPNSAKISIIGASELPLLGMQFTLDFGQEIGLNEIKGMHLKVNEENFRLDEKNRKISFSWGALIPQDIDEMELFSIALTKTIDITKVVLNSSITQVEAYAEDGELINLVLDQKSTPSSHNAFIVNQNSPNPFHNFTQIDFVLPEEGTVQFSVLNLNGKLLYGKNIQGKKGQNNIQLSRNDISGNGLVFYTMTYGEQTFTNKMIIIE